MKEIKKKVEAILFSIGKYISLEDIARLCKKELETIKEALLELQADYETDNNTSLIVLNEGDRWKLSTREEYGNIVRKIVSETELTKTQMETLAVIAFKYPIKQSDLIKIRTNKAYEHLSELEKVGFITRQKYGRSRLIKLTDKFFEYFDLPREKLKNRFKGFEDLATTIEHKEVEIEKAKEEQRQAAEDAKEQEEKERKVMDGEIDLVDDKGEKHELETFEEPKEEPKVEKVQEKLGDLEVVDETVAEEEKSEDVMDEKEGEKSEDKAEELKSVDDVLGKKEESESEETGKELKVEKEKSDEEAKGEEINEKSEETNDDESEEDNDEKDEEGVDLLEAEQEKEKKEN